MGGAGRPAWACVPTSPAGAPRRARCSTGRWSCARSSTGSGSASRPGWPAPSQARASLVSGGAQATRVTRDLLSRSRPRAGDRLDTRLQWRLASAELAAAEGDGVAARRSAARGLDVLHAARARLGAPDLRGGASVHGRDLARLGVGLAVREGQPAEVLRLERAGPGAGPPAATGAAAGRPPRGGLAGRAARGRRRTHHPTR